MRYIKKPYNLSEQNFWEQSYHGLRKSKRYLPNPRWRLGHFELDRVFRQYLPRTKGLRLLEMGCGSSMWLPYFCQKFGYQVVGVDYSQTGVEQAESNLSMAGCQGQIIQSDFWNLNSDFKRQFDILFSFGVVEHFDNPEAVISHFNTFLKGNGLMITYIPNLVGIMGPLLKLANKEFYETHRLISLEELERYHVNCKMKVLFSSYIQPFDLNIINLSKLGSTFAYLGHAAFAAIDLPILALCKLIDKPLSSRTFSSAILVLAQKEEN